MRAPRRRSSAYGIADLGKRLNVALAQRVQELLRYRSEFFGELHEILGNHPDIRVVGDRFVFQSELFFDSGAAVLRQEGRAELDQLATALLDLDTRIPSELNWVCASMAIPTHGRLPFRLSNRTGSCPPRVR
jgi:chemotaxis protein MotB